MREPEGKLTAVVVDCDKERTNGTGAEGNASEDARTAGVALEAGTDEVVEDGLGATEGVTTSVGPGCRC